MLHTRITKIQHLRCNIQSCGEYADATPSAKLINQHGFTLIEIITVLILLGILAAVAVPKYLDLSDHAKDKAIDAGITELNARENHAWGKIKLSSPGWVSDPATYTTIDIDLGADYTWSVPPTITGGTLQFQSGTGVALTRTPSSATSPGNWKRT